MKQQWINNGSHDHKGSAISEITTNDNKVRICVVDDNESNAHLIAAAPELLAALDDLIYKLTELNSEGKLEGLGLDVSIGEGFLLTERAKGESE